MQLAYGQAGHERIIGRRMGVRLVAMLVYLAVLLRISNSRKTLVYKQAFTPFDYEEYKEKYRQTKIANLERALKRLKDMAA